MFWLGVAFGATVTVVVGYLGALWYLSRNWYG